MSDLISRSTLLEAMENLRKDNRHSDAKSRAQHNSEITACIKRVVEQPTVEAVPVVHGCVKTVVGKMGVMHQECSACGNVLEWKAYPNYCDECGAKLDGADMRTSAD